MSIGAVYKLPDIWRYQDRSGVRLTTLEVDDIGRTAKLREIRPPTAPAPRPRLLQRVGVLGRHREVAWEYDVCLSQRCTSFEIVGDTRTKVASGRRHCPQCRIARGSAAPERPRTPFPAVAAGGCVGTASRGGEGR